MTNALNLLVALRALLPEVIGSLTLDKETGRMLVVTLCDQAAHTWHSFKLDSDDLARLPEDVARDIVSLRKVHDGTKFGIAAAGSPREDR